MTTAYFSHPDSLAHVTPPGHPERVERLHAVAAAVEAPAFADLERHSPPLAEDAALLRCHPAAYIDRVAQAAPAQGWRALDADTHMVAASPQAARRAAGAAMAAVDLVLAGGAANAFCAMRPPGHHAERATAMGFCLFGNVAVAAKHALDHHGLGRVAILDFDVHHGNGTQDLLWDEERVRFASLHQSPLYPGSGSPRERGGHGQILNLPLPPYSDGAAVLGALKGEALPFLEEAAPELLLVSAGFDGHRDDPLAQWALTTADYAAITEALCDLADRACSGRLVSCLEGGYDLAALADSVAAHLQVLMSRGQAHAAGAA